MQSRNKLVYYHQHFRRVPTIDECEIDDQLCFFEAERQFARDRFDLRVKLNRHRYSFAFLPSYPTFRPTASSTPAVQNSTSLCSHYTPLSVDGPVNSVYNGDTWSYVDARVSMTHTHLEDWFMDGHSLAVLVDYSVWLCQPREYMSTSGEEHWVS